MPVCGFGGLVSSLSLLIRRQNHACRQGEISLIALFKNPEPALLSFGIRTTRADYDKLVPCGVKLARWKPKRSHFSNCKFSGAKRMEVDFGRALLTQCDLTNIDLTRCKNFRFDQTTIGGARLPNY